MIIMKKRFISAVILAAMLLSVASCGTTEEDQKESGASTGSTETSAEETVSDNGRENVKDSLPDNLDFEGQTIRIMTRGGDSDVKNELDSDGESREVVSEAIYKRNRNVEERLNVKLEFIYTDNTRHNTDANGVLKLIMSDSDEFDIGANMMAGMIPLIAEGAFLDLKAQAYFDFDQPWWNQSFMEATEINGKNYLTIGELSQTMISGSFAVFFNKKMFEEMYPDEPTLYEAVKNGEWTLDKMIGYCSGVYSDLNGNTEADEGDRFGNYYRDGKMLGSDAYLGGCAIHLIEQNNDGSFTYGGTSERMASYLEKMHTLLFENNNTFRSEYNNDTVMTLLAADQALFTTWMLEAVNYLRDMESDYGIIPMPKLDTTQADYNSYCHNGSTLFFLPATCRRAEASAAVLEAMSAETYRSVTPAYFEIALKQKYSRDSETSEMLDMIVESVSFDLAYIYELSIGTPIDFMRDVLSSETNCSKGYTRLVAKEKPIITNMEKVMESYDKLG